MFRQVKNNGKTPPVTSRDQHIGQPPAPVNRIQLSGLICVATTAFLTACSISSGDGLSASKDEIVTSSVTKPAEIEGIGTRDAEIIKATVVQSDSGALLAWQNPESGNKGTITAIDKFVGSNGQQCKKFQTTVDTFMGVSLYNGETCELKKGFWVLSWFIRQDS